MKTYRAWIEEAIKNTNLADEREAQAIVDFLQDELLRMHKTTTIYEAKLQELMTEEEREEWAKEAGRRLFADTVDRMPESAFKDFVLQNFDSITQ